MRLAYSIHCVCIQLLTVLMVGGCFISLSACGTATKLLKADPALPSGFIDKPEQMAEVREHAPFHALWFKDREEFDRVRGEI